MFNFNVYVPEKALLLFEEVLAFYQKCVDDGQMKYFSPSTEEDVRRWLSTCKCFTVRDAKKLIGFFGVNIGYIPNYLIDVVHSSTTKRSFALLNFTFVDSKYQGLGIAKSLLKLGLDECSVNGHYDVYATIDPKNKAILYLLNEIGLKCVYEGDFFE